MSASAADTAEGTGVEVLLFDPSPLSRSCLLAGFGDSPGIAITACGDLDDLPDPAFSDGKPDILAVHAAGQDLESPQFVRRLQLLTRRFPQAARMLLSGPDDAAQMRAGLQLGFNAYVTEGVGLSLTIGVMRLIRQGMIVYPDSFLKGVAEKGDWPLQGSSNGAASLPLARDLLTPRQLDVLRLLARGFSNKAIASDLDISESTVKVHIRAIMERTGMLNRTQIVAHFFGPH